MTRDASRARKAVVVVDVTQGATHGYVRAG